MSTLQLHSCLGGMCVLLHNYFYPLKTHSLLNNAAFVNYIDILFQFNRFLDWSSALCLQIQCLEGTVPVGWFSQQAELSLLVLIHSLREDVSKKLGCCPTTSN